MPMPTATTTRRAPAGAQGRCANRSRGGGKLAGGGEPAGGIPRAGPVVGRAVHVERLPWLEVPPGEAIVEDVVLIEFLPEAPAQGEERQRSQIRVDVSGEVHYVGLQ